MKAKEYFEKYGEDIWKEAHETEFRQDGAFANIFIDFFAEMKDLIELKHVKTDRGLLHLINEQNQKWNAVCAQFEKKYGVSPLKRDGFKTSAYRRLGVKVDCCGTVAEAVK